MAASNFHYDNFVRKPSKTSDKLKGFVGLLLLVAGFCIVIHYWLVFETTVEVEDRWQRIEVVQDADLLQMRTVGTIVGIAATVLGGVMMLLGPRRR